MFSPFFLPTLAVITIPHLVYLLPLVVTISLVYGATRHEETGPILHHSVRFGIWISSCLGVLFIITFFLSWGL